MVCVMHPGLEFTSNSQAADTMHNFSNEDSSLVRCHAMQYLPMSSKILAFLRLLDPQDETLGPNKTSVTT